MLPSRPRASIFIIHILCLGRVEKVLEIRLQIHPRVKLPYFFCIAVEKQRVATRGFTEMAFLGL